MKEGDIFHGFLLEKVEDLTEIRSTLVQARHLIVGSQVMALIHDDDENVFNLCFPTHPNSSNGVAHVLEHTVLCGSKKYPVKDPFFSMLRRSLNTFMNAFTGADFTCYPAASQIPEDFYNLLKVYIDSVFHPLLRKESFLQEGWRLEFAPAAEGKEVLSFNGIVFNEMKGALMTAEARLSEAIGVAMFPDITYGVNSGGDPAEIIDLTIEDLKRFHEIYYHPSQCLFYFYGNFPLQEHLRFLNEEVLSEVTSAPEVKKIPLQTRFSTPVYQQHYYPLNDPDLKDKSLVGFSWLTCHIHDQDTLLAFNVIELVLMGTDASPLKSELLRSGLCKQADASIDNEMQEAPFTLHCKGCDKEAAPLLEKLIRSVLEKLCKDGISPQLIEGAVHQLELSRKEIGGYSYPYGLSLFFRAGLLKQHGGHPLDGLSIHKRFGLLREQLKSPFYLTDIIKKYLLDNPHFVCITMSPDPDLIEKEKKEEADRLQLRTANFSDKDYVQVRADMIVLQKYQDADDEYEDILPKIALSKISRKTKEFELNELEGENFKIFHHDCFTNDIIFVDLVAPLADMDSSSLSWLRLFVFLAPQLGCGGRSYKEHLEYLLEHTGGIDFTLDLSPHAQDCNKINPSISIRGKVLEHKRAHLFSVFSDMISSIDFSDKERIKEILMQHAESLTNSLRKSPASYAVNWAAAPLSLPGSIQYQIYGVPYVKMIQRLSDCFEELFFEIQTSLQDIHQRCLGIKGTDMLLSCDTKTLKKLQQEQFYGIGAAFKKTIKPWTPTLNTPLSFAPNRAMEISSAVAFNVAVFPLNISYTDSDAAALAVASHLMDNLVLHPEIREKGGAYGSGVTGNFNNGSFYFSSYRDPAIITSFAAFDQAVTFITSEEFDDEDLDEAVLSVLQDIDGPIAPGARASLAYFRLKGGRTPELRKQYRDALFEMTSQKVIDVVIKVIQSQKDKKECIIFAGEALLKEAAGIFVPELAIEKAFDK
ncbi:Presequence protease 1, chloroplastic/mitochondrial [Candidatus Clavichlamydia salmonicola]|uniref:insulinase family protein n=1 Tax=Candidatus Clavichlamydia salmonicola TaxID=469812 RepID=UPI001890C872|nr:insulinase family protein [Candidatus Clavichlamydia salmonicola]MBF5050452.1 Presequence protease 1, chloroplastic/mitochondrial [Candidatus Clavichlamydia salmonicola]